LQELEMGMYECTFCKTIKPLKMVIDRCPVCQRSIRIFNLTDNDEQWLEKISERFSK